MGHTNQTTNLHLPQFIGSDKPTWLSDMNGAFLAIDNAYGTIETDSAAAVTAAGNAVTAANAANTTAGNASTAAASASNQAGQALTAANNAAGTANNAYTKAESALDRVNGQILAQVTSDGVKTVGQLLNDLRAAVTGAVSVRAVLNIGAYYMPMIYNDGGAFNFTYATNDSTGKGFIVRYKVANSNSSAITLKYDGAAWSMTDDTSVVPAAGDATYTLYA